MMISKQIRVYSDTHERLSSMKVDKSITFDEIINTLADIAGIPTKEQKYEHIAMPVWQDK
jgi:hypothetical protein